MWVQKEITFDFLLLIWKRRQKNKSDQNLNDLSKTAGK